MPNANPLRLLLAVAGVPSAETGRALQALSGALRGVGVAPILLSGWAGAGRLRVERSDAEGFPVYRSDAPLADIGLLAVMERPSIAVLVGAEALPLAGPLVAMGLPVILVVTGDQPLDLGALENTGLLALAATTPAEAARLARLQSGPVMVLPLPAPEKARFEGDGAAILVLGGQRAEGVAVALALAEARPVYRFIFPATVAQTPAVLGRVSRLTNTQILAIDENVPPLRLGLLPNCVGVPPWETLAEVMRARVPLMVGDAPLLAAGIGAAGLSLALTAPGEAWFAALDTLMETGAERARAEAACADQSALLRPSAAQAARRWYETLQEYRARCLGFSAGRV